MGTDRLPKAATMFSLIATNRHLCMSASTTFQVHIQTPIICVSFFVSFQWGQIQRQRNWGNKVALGHKKLLKLGLRDFGCDGHCLKHILGCISWQIPRDGLENVRRLSWVRMYWVDIEISLCFRDEPRIISWASGNLGMYRDVQYILTWGSVRIHSGHWKTHQESSHRTWYRIG